MVKDIKLSFCGKKSIKQSRISGENTISVKSDFHLADLSTFSPWPLLAYSYFAGFVPPQTEYIFNTLKMVFEDDGVHFWNFFAGFAIRLDFYRCTFLMKPNTKLVEGFRRCTFLTPNLLGFGEIIIFEYHHWKNGISSIISNVYLHFQGNKSLACFLLRLTGVELEICLSD